MSVAAPEYNPQSTSMTPRYDLAPTEIHDLTNRFLNQPGLPMGRFVCVNFAPDSPMTNVGRAVEQSVFNSTFQNDTKVMEGEYGPYEQASHFLTVFDRKRKVAAGVIRIVSHSGEGLKSLNDLESQTGVSIEEFQERQNVPDLKTCWDIGTLAVAPEYRGKLSSFEVSTMLYRGLFRLMERERVSDIVMMIDKKARRGVDTLGVPLKEIEGTGVFPYLGSSETFALHGKPQEFQEGVSNRAEELRQAAKLTLNDIKHPSMKRFLRRRITAKIGHKLATGKTLDSQMAFSTF